MGQKVITHEAAARIALLVGHILCDLAGNRYRGFGIHYTTWLEQCGVVPDEEGELPEIETILSQLVKHYRNKKGCSSDPCAVSWVVREAFKQLGLDLEGGELLC